MSALALSMLLAALAGAGIPLGAAAATTRLGPRWLEGELRHGIIAFGGGVLFAAVALVLVPEGIAALPVLPAALAFAAGGLVFLFCDRAIAANGGSAAQLLAMLLDFIPEAMAMGAMLASGAKQETALLLVLLIGLQNIPEGFNAFREITEGRRAARRRTFWLFVAVVPLGPLAAFVGEEHLTQMPAVLGAVMLFAAGGIVYLTFQDIAPEARMRKRWGPPFGAVAGFLVGMIGQMLLGHV